MISISVDNLEAVRDRFAKLIPRLKATALRTLAQQVHDDVQDGADRHTQKGQLARSVFLRQAAPEVWETGHDQQKAAHALFVVWGTKPHPIPKPGKPMKRKALRWPQDGKFVFAKSVKHPGYKGDNYLHDAARNAPKHMAGIVSELQREI